jgi:hypothetical protein
MCRKNCPSLFINCDVTRAKVFMPHAVAVQKALRVADLNQVIQYAQKIRTV